MKKFIFLVLFAVLSLGGCSSTVSSNKDIEASSSKSEIKEAVYFMGGKVQANQEARLTTKIPARVSKIDVEVGSTVKAGDSLIFLDTKDIEAQLGQAAAGIDVAKANLIKVQKGARPEQIEQLKANLDSAEKSYENAKLVYERNKALYDSGAIPIQQLETSEGQLKSAESQYKYNNEQLLMTLSGETKETINVLQSQVKQAQAAAQVIETQLSNGTIVSPISGIVSEKNISKGELAVSGSILISIVNTDSLYVDAYLPARLAGEVKKDQIVSVRVSEIPDKESKGIIEAISPIVDSKSKSILVKVRLDNADKLIKPGMFAEIGFSK